MSSPDVKHTPLPWVQDDANPELIANFNKDGCYNYICDMGAVFANGMDKRTTEEYNANAAFIIRAVNNFYPLVEALKLVKSMRTVEALSPAEHQFEIDKREEAWDKIDEKIDEALSALENEK